MARTQNESIYKRRYAVNMFKSPCDSIKAQIYHIL